jgi:hypothetical protein
VGTSAIVPNNEIAASTSPESGRWHQALSLGLAAIPIAERMLLYHVLMTAWMLLPGKLPVE